MDSRSDFLTRVLIGFAALVIVLISYQFIMPRLTSLTMPWLMRLFGGPIAMISLLDYGIPLNPQWLPIYLSLFIFLALPLFYKNYFDLNRFLLFYEGLIWSHLFTYIFNLIVITESPRPGVALPKGFFWDALKILYDIDRADGVFPSSHVIMTVVALIFLRKAGIPWLDWIFFLVWGAAISVSTLFVKQHFVADVVAGFGLAFTVKWWSLKISRSYFGRKCNTAILKFFESISGWILGEPQNK